MGHAINSSATAGSPERNLLSAVIHLALDDLLPARTVLSLSPNNYRLRHHESALYFLRSKNLSLFCDWLVPEPSDVRKAVRARIQ
ncbi:MAG: hypothetical protein KAV00_03330 [Phycisphaerae bacterium]|nr:hypothetical protein [Phycisphaerae bacterium]